MTFCWSLPLKHVGVVVTTGRQATISLDSKFLLFTTNCSKFFKKNLENTKSISLKGKSYCACLQTKYPEHIYNMYTP